MVGFKKDNDSFNNIKKYLMTFISGFIIATFLVLFLLMTIINRLNNGNSDPTSSSEPLSSEASSIDASSSYDYEKEIKIYNNLLDVIKDYEPNINSIDALSYDEDKMYVATLDNDDNLYIFSLSLNEEDIDTVLNRLINQKEGIEVESMVNAYDRSTLPPINVINTDAFKNEYNGYHFNKTIYYYIDSSLDVIGVSTIGFKNNEYISLIHVRYDINFESMIDDPIKGYISEINNNESLYYSFLEYLSI